MTASLIAANKVILFTTLTIRNIKLKFTDTSTCLSGNFHFQYFKTFITRHSVCAQCVAGSCSPK